MSTQTERDEEHERILREVLQEPSEDEQPKSSILPFLIGAALIIILALWFLPEEGFPPRAQRGKVPGIETLAPETITITERPTGQGIDAYVTSDDPELKRIASLIVTAACSEPDQRCYADALFYFVRDNIAYVADPLEEYYELPRETINARAADCDGHAILLASLLRSVGVLTRFNYDTPRHVAVEAWVPRHSLLQKSDYAFGWRYLDATCTSCDPGERMPLA